jgi:hypothetical protein
MMRGIAHIGELSVSTRSRRTEVAERLSTPDHYTVPKFLADLVEARLDLVAAPAPIGSRNHEKWGSERLD